MAWTKPTLNEVALSSEINAYVCGAQREGEGEILSPAFLPQD